MSTLLMPAAEDILNNGMHRALVLIREGRPTADVARVLEVAGSAAELIQSDTETLGQP